MKRRSCDTLAAYEANKHALAKRTRFPPERLWSSSLLREEAGLRSSEDEASAAAFFFLHPNFIFLADAEFGSASVAN